MSFIPSPFGVNTLNDDNSQTSVVVSQFIIFEFVIKVSISQPNLTMHCMLNVPVSLNRCVELIREDVLLKPLFGSLKFQSIEAMSDVLCTLNGMESSRHKLEGLTMDAE